MAPIRFGTFELDAHTGELRRDGAKIRLEGQPLRVLAILLEHAGELVTRDDLKKQLWNTETFVDFEHGINTAVKRLREALEDSADAPRFIETLPRRGYRFVYPVQRQAPPSSSPPRTRRRLAKLVTAGVACVAAVTVGASLPYWRARHGGGRITSVAVLPCSNLSGDVNQEYVADGMTDELTASLSKIRALTVKSGTSAMTAKGTQLTVQEIGRRLHVDGIVECSVRRSGNQIDITVKLIDAPTDAHVWAETYRRDAQSVITVQDEAARDIARAIALALTPEETRALQTQGTSNPQAYQAYLKGRHYFLNGRISKAIDSFSQAVTLDARFAPAYAGLAASLSLQPAELHLSSAEFGLRTKAAAMKALEIDERLGEAHAVLAWTTLTYDWDWKAADVEFERALTLNPNDEIAHMWYGCELVWDSNFDRGLAELKRAQDLAPAVASVSAYFGMGLYLARRYELAVRQLSEAIELDPTLPLPYSFLGLSLSATGRHAEAIAALEKGVTLTTARASANVNILARLGFGYAAAGQREKAAGVIEELKRRSVSPITFVMIEAALGNKTAAFDSLEQAFERHDRAIEMLFLKVDPRVDTLRADPRFQESLRRIGFP